MSSSNLPCGKATGQGSCRKAERHIMTMSLVPKALQNPQPSTSFISNFWKWSEKLLQTVKNSLLAKKSSSHNSIESHSQAQIPTKHKGSFFKPSSAPQAKTLIFVLCKYPPWSVKNTCPQRLYTSEKTMGIILACKSYLRRMGE